MNAISLIFIIVLGGGLFGVVAALVFLKLARAIFPLKIVISLKTAAIQPSEHHLTVSNLLQIENAGSLEELADD